MKHQWVRRSEGYPTFNGPVVEYWYECVRCLCSSAGQTLTQEERDQECQGLVAT